MAMLTKFFPFKSLAAIVGLFLAWQAYVFVSPAPRDYSDAELSAVDAVCDQLARQLDTWTQRELSQPDAPTNIEAGVVHFINDPSDTLTERVKSRLAESPRLNVEQNSIIQRFLADTASAVKNATSLDEVLHAGRRVDLDLIVAGKALSVVERDGVGQATFDIYAYDPEAASWIVKEKFQAQSTPQEGSRAEAGGITGLHPVWRFLIWFGVVLVLPWITAPAVHRVVEIKSNAASAILLGLYILAGAILALLLNGFQIAGVWDGIKLTVAIVFCAVYSYIVSERIAEG